MPKCADCQYEGKYDLTRPGAFMATPTGMQEMKYMRCQAGASANPISQREAKEDFPCNSFKRKATTPKPVAKPKPIKEQKSFEGTDSNIVYQQVLAALPPHMLFESISIVSEIRDEVVTGAAPNSNQARQRAKQHLPDNATVKSEEISEPDPILKTITDRNF